LPKIVVPVGTYKLTISGTSTNEGSLKIFGKLRVKGASTTGTIIDAAGLGAQVIEVKTGASTTISNLMITGGNDDTGGGGISVGSNATTTLSGVTVTANPGGGIDNDGTLTIDDSSITGNTGGGIHSRIINSGNTLTVNNSTISENTSTDFGGGISNGGKLTVNNSTISGNTAGDEGGGIFNGDSGTLTISQSTVSGNTAASGAGGIASNGGDVDILNSTISGNTANGGNGEGLEHDSTSGTLTIINSTIANNVAAPGKDGGGIAVTNGTVQIANTILAGNTAGGDGPNCSVNSDSQSSELGCVDYNLIQDPSDCVVTGAIANTVIGDPKLGPLADNGGPTKTHALLVGSPAIGKGNPATPGSSTSGDSCLATDQRGISRPQGSNCDIGAFEFTVATQPTPVPGVSQWGLIALGVLMSIVVMWQLARRRRGGATTA
jgi:hypothetical protein